MFEVIAIAVAVQVSVNWVTHALSPSAPSEVQHIEVNVDAEDVLCSTSETFVYESKVLQSQYELQGLSTYDIIELYSYETPELDRPDANVDIDNPIDDPVMEDIIIRPLPQQPTIPTVPTPAKPSKPAQPIKPVEPAKPTQPVPPVSDPRLLIW